MAKAHPGLGIRTPRTRALEMGTSKAGFEDVEAGYSSRGGYPIGPGMPDQVYEELPPQSTPKDSKSVKSPFKGG